MIILEGMDGSGKTHLAAALTKDLGLPMAERASSSIGGPIADLFDWVNRDIDCLHTRPLSIYDRHPLISEFIYGPVVRGTIDDRFLRMWFQRRLHKWRDNAFVVFCDPGDEAMGRNLAEDINQMPGVAENFNRLACAYRCFFANYTGQWTLWNYTRPQTYDWLLDSLKIHISQWKDPISA